MLIAMGIKNMAVLIVMVGKNFVSKVAICFDFLLSLDTKYQILNEKEYKNYFY